MKVFDETAKSFGTKLETQIDKLKDQALKDKQAYIEKERKAQGKKAIFFFLFYIESIIFRELARIEAAAKQHISANIGEDRNDLLTKVWLNMYFVLVYVYIFSNVNNGLLKIEKLKIKI